MCSMDEERMELSDRLRCADRMKIKIVMLGDQYVGKTSLVERFTEDKFVNFRRPTVGIDYASKEIDPTTNMEIWDTGGQETFASLTKQYYRCSSAAILVYDVGNVASFKGIKRWLYELRQGCDHAQVRILCGNKIDQFTQYGEVTREVSYNEGEAFANDHNLKFFEVSAKSGEGVNDMFISIYSAIIKMLTANEETPQSLGMHTSNGIGPSFLVKKGKIVKMQKKKRKSKCC